MADDVAVVTIDSETIGLIVSCIVNEELVLPLGVIRGLVLKDIVTVNELSELALKVCKAEGDTVVSIDSELSELIVGVNREDDVSVFAGDSELSELELGVCKSEGDTVVSIDSETIGLSVCPVVIEDVMLLLGDIDGLALKDLITVNEFSELALKVCKADDVAVFTGDSETIRLPVCPVVIEDVLLLLGDIAELADTVIRAEEDREGLPLIDPLIV